MKKLAILLILSPLLGFGQAGVLYPNDGSTGTVINTLAFVNSSGNAITATTSNTAVAVYIVVGGAGTAGSATLAFGGQASCKMDSSSGTAGMYVIASTGTAGDCHPQSAAPGAGVFVVGWVATATTTSGTASAVNVDSFIYGGSAGGLAESSISGSTAATTITENATGDAISRAGVETGNLTAPQVVYNTNSTNNNTDIGLIVGAAGSSTGGIGELVFDASGTGDIVRWYTGGSVAAGVYTVGTLEGHLSNAGALTIAGAFTGNYTVAGPVVTTSGGLTSTGTFHTASSIYQCADTSSSATTYTCTTSPSAGSLTAGDVVILSAVNQNNSGDSTLNVDAIGAKHIRKWQNTATLASGDLQASATQWLTYDGTYFEIPTIGNAPSGGGGGALSSITAPVASVTFTQPAGDTTTFNGTAPASSGSTGTAGVTDFILTQQTGGATTGSATTAGVGASGTLNCGGTGGSGSGGTNAIGGAGGTCTLSGGAGGASGGTAANAAGGSIFLLPGAAGTGGSGTAGAIGQVVIGTQNSAPAGVLNIAGSSAAGGSLIFSGDGASPNSTTISAGAVNGYLGIGTTSPDMTVGISGSLEVNSGATPSGATFNGSITGTSTTAAITAGTGLTGTGQFVYMPGNGGGTTEIAYGTYSGTTFTFAAPPIGSCASATAGRGCYGTTAQSHSNGTNLYAVNNVVSTGIANLPTFMSTIGGPTFIVASLSAMNDVPLTTTDVFFGIGVAVVNGNGVIFGQPNGPTGGVTGVNTSGIELFAQNNNGNNATLITNSITPSRPITSQSITGTSLTAITTTVTPAYSTNASAASATVHGQLESECEIMWEQSTAVATVQFGVKLSAAPTDLYVIDEDFNGTTVTSSGITTITTTTTTATSPSLTPANFGTGPYWTKITLIMNPGTTNSPTVQLYGLTSNASDALLIEPGTGCSAWH